MVRRGSFLQVSTVTVTTPSLLPVQTLSYIQRLQAALMHAVSSPSARRVTGCKDGEPDAALTLLALLFDSFSKCPALEPYRAVLRLLQPCRSKFRDQIHSRQVL